MDILLGESDFPTLRRRGGAYVDKTRLIRSLLDHGSKVTLFTRPRRFGKTLAMSMLRAFFDVASAEAAPSLFDGLAIWRAGQAYVAQAGTRPTVFLTLKDLRERDMVSFSAALARRMAVLYQSFAFLREDAALLPEERAYYQRIAAQAAGPGELQDALRSLTVMLERHYGRPVLLLLDEYDVPVAFAQERGYYDEAMDVLRNFFSAALKDNPSLDFAVLTGVLRIAKESIFSGLNNLTVSSVAAGGYADAFGFTEQEVTALAEACGQSAHLEELRAWYDGYDFQGAELYNPWSVMNYFANACEPQTYWANTATNATIREILSQADGQLWREMQRLMDGGCVFAPIEDDIVYRDLSGNRNAIYSVLLASGYLKSVGRAPDMQDVYRLEIPNREVRQIFKREILSAMDTGTGKVSAALFEMLRAMEAGDTAAFEEELQDIFLRYVSVHDVARRPENFYHGFLLGFLLYFEDSYHIQSNRESGDGRFDLCMTPMRGGLPGILLEFKAVKQEGALERVAKAARAQIGKRHYAATLESEGVQTIWGYGIAFCGKHVRVAGGA